MLSDSIKKLHQYVRHYGVVGLGKKIIERSATKSDYDNERLKHLVTEEELLKQSQDIQDADPVISIIVPVYQPERIPFIQMLESVKAQSYTKWQLCLADASEESVEPWLKQCFGLDSRIRYMALSSNEGISGNTNMAISGATGEFLAFLDQDDLLEPDALYEVALCIRKGAQIIYTDEDKVDAQLNCYERPFCKPDYNETLLFNTNYFCHLTVIERELVLNIGGLRPEYDGAQDYDLILRAVAKSTKIAHVDKVLYHWRSNAGSTSDNPFAKAYAFAAGKKALKDALLSRGRRNVRVTERENPGYYQISMTEPSPYEAVVVKDLSDVPDVSETDYVMVLPTSMTFTTGNIDRLLERAKITGADIVVPKQVKNGKYIYNGIAKAGKGHTVSLVGQPSWYHGPYQLAVINMDVDVAPTQGILIRSSLLEALQNCEEKHLNRKIEWCRKLRMVYAPEVILTKSK